MMMNNTNTNTNNIMYPYRWNPTSIHPCNINQMNEIEFETKFGPNGLPPLYPSPIVITATSTTSTRTTKTKTKTTSSSEEEEKNQKQQQKQQKRKQQQQQQQKLKFQKLTQNDTILNSFTTNFYVTLSSSNSFSEHRKIVPFHEYLNDYVLYGNDTLPNQLSNETWYLFGETYDDEWTQLLQNYQIPNCHACKYPDLVALSFGIGNRGSGVQWHVHGPGFSESIHGRKHWILSPNKPNFHPDQTSLNWMEYTYTNITKTTKAATTNQKKKKKKKKKQQIMVEEEEEGLRKNDDDDDDADDDDGQHSTNTYYECTLYPGDIIYFPDMWWHATINLDTYTAFVSTFTQEHKLVLMNDDDHDHDHHHYTRNDKYDENEFDDSSSWEL